jgi:hypothetical protein
MMSDHINGVEMLHPGKEVDMTFAQKAVIDELYQPSIQTDANIGYLPPFFFIPFASAVPYFTHTESAIYTHTSSKVVRYPAIVKKIVSKQDQITHTTENLAFDKFTGKPIVQKSYDDYAGAYVSQSIPASWEYKNMRAISQNQGLRISVDGYESDSDGEFLTFNGSSCDNMDLFVRGDLIELADKVLYHVDEFDYFGSRVKVVPSSLNSSNFSGSISEVKVVQSGYTNQLTAQAGQIVYHSDNSSIGLPQAMDPNDSGQTRWISESDDVLAEPNAVFLTDLNAMVRNNTSGSEGDLALSGVYEKMDVSIYYADFPDECSTIDPSSTTISNVQLYYYRQSNALDVQIVSFDIECGSGNFYTVKSNRVL